MRCRGGYRKECKYAKVFVLCKGSGIAATHQINHFLQTDGSKLMITAHTSYNTTGKHLTEFERRLFKADCARCIAQEKTKIDVNNVACGEKSMNSCENRMEVKVPKASTRMLPLN